MNATEGKALATVRGRVQNKVTKKIGWLTLWPKGPHCAVFVGYATEVVTGKRKRKTIPMYEKWEKGEVRAAAGKSKSLVPSRRRKGGAL